MNENSMAHDSDPDDAPDLSRNGWPEKFAEATVRRGRRTRIDEAFRKWIGKHGAA